MTEIQRAVNLVAEFVRGGKVIVDGLAGAVVVEGWERSEVSLTGTKRVRAPSEADAERALAVMETAFRRDGDELTISVSGDPGGHRYASSWIDCYIRVPAETDLYVDTSSGSVNVRGVTGRIRLDTGSGAATLRQCGGDIVVDTGSGAVVAEDIAGNLNIDVGSGAVAVSGVAGELFVDAGSGSVHIRRAGGKVTVDSGGSVTVSDAGGDLIIDAGGNVKATSVRGRFVRIEAGGFAEAELVVQPGGRYSVEAGGEARISVPPDANLEIKGEAGGLKYELPLKVRRLDDDEFEATLNGRGALLEVEIGGRLTLLPLRTTAGGGADAGRVGDPAPPAADEAASARAAAAETADGENKTADAGEPAGDNEAGDEDETGAAEVGGSDASAEIRAIIKMVAEKRITPEEAEELLKALGRGPADR